MAETLSDTQLRLETIIRNNYPSVDIAPGTVLSELLIKLATTLQNPIVNSISELSQGNTIDKILASDVDTYDPLMDAVASNYNVQRADGKKSVGKVKIVVTDKSARFISKNFELYQPVLKLSYVTTATYQVTTNPVSATDLLLIPEGATYYFILPVEAKEVGPEYQLSANTKLSLAASKSITGFVDAYAFGSFTSGLQLDTDKILVSKLQTGLTHKTLLTEASIKARLTDLYPNFRDLSIVRAGDAEMTRDKQNLFGLATLGMSDVYVRTSFGPETISLTRTATQTDGVWSITLGLDDEPGFYRVISILPSGKELTGTITNTQVFNYSTAGILPANTVNNSQEGRFTKYQTCTIAFEYPSSDTTAAFDFLLSYQPNIASIQDLMLSSDERITCADYLVKAALPCFVTVGLKLHRRTSSELPVDKIKQDIYNYVNSVKFGETLHASKIIDICHNYDVKYVEFPIKLTGSIYTNKGTVINISGADSLQIPTVLSAGVSPKTTLFFADYLKTGASDIDNQNNMSESISVVVI